jgi:hypothetical protein
MKLIESNPSARSWRRQGFPSVKLKTDGRTVAMNRRYAAILLLAGCSTNPVADVWDTVLPARNVCSKANSSPVGAPGVAVPGAALPPGCEAALRENQNYRRGLLDRFRRTNYPSAGVPPATQVPATNP